MAESHVNTLILRITHIHNLEIILSRGGIHAPNYMPEDGFDFKSIHNVEIQSRRSETYVNCGPGGCLHDYVAFYFGKRSPMLYQLHTGYVRDYHEGQEPIIYLVSTAQLIVKSGNQFVFSDGHGIANFTKWYDNLRNLNKLNWDDINARYWNDNESTDGHRQRRKQAEFLVYKFCDWSLLTKIVVINSKIKDNVKEIICKFPKYLNKPISIKRNWYY